MRYSAATLLLCVVLVGCGSEQDGSSVSGAATDHLLGRWASSDAYGVAILETQADLRCSLSIWSYEERTQLTSSRCLASPGDARAWSDEQKESAGWRFSEVYYLTVAMKEETHTLKAAVFVHPYESPVMTIQEEGDEIVGDFWTKLRNPRGMLAAGIGLSPELSAKQKACVIEGIEAEASDDVLDVLFEIYPDRFNFDWEAHWDAVAFAEYLESECGVEQGLVDLVDQQMY